ncbi:SEC-C domain-containing protein [Methanolobus sp. ZRKC5]|uniref:SEC-C domain-containing protein n=1 Tax=unclassified Methanolobus TaxID=2629569 RepID=UPI00313B54F2
MSIGSKENYKVTLNESINENILNLLSLSFGCNENWTSPLGKSEIDFKPIISIDGDYYCFLTPHLIRNVISIIESLFSTKEFSKYTEIKSKYFEQKSLELLSNVLPNATIHKSLYYPFYEDEKEKWPEIDGIISYEDSLLLVEIKAKNKRSIAGRKDILTISKGDFKKNITEAFDQSKRALEYISSSEEVSFYDSNNKNKKEVLKLKKENYSNIFLVNITLEAFQDLSTSLNTVKLWDAKLLSGNHYPFAVSIYDLMIITELLENSDDFIKYLIERNNLELNQEISSLDEIDFLGYFLEHSTLSKTSDLPKSDITLLNGYSSNIEKYYSYLQGEIEYAEKPVRKKTQTEIIREKLESGFLSKNNRCWCGSNKKYKHCCGRN